RDYLALVPRYAFALQLRPGILGGLSARQPTFCSGRRRGGERKRRDLGARLSPDADGALSAGGGKGHSRWFLSAYSVSSAGHLRETALAQDHSEVFVALRHARLPDRPRSVELCELPGANRSGSA